MLKTKNFPTYLYIFYHSLYENNIILTLINYNFLNKGTRFTFTRIIDKNRNTNLIP